MDPSTRPTQSARNWSTHEDAGSREVKILGHISRPVVGEGRQTPDRQMFFVNSRPCSLPQVAKAFNEAYKLYNITQSPFIFANLNLDTNAYDVNVSPDKRTILLHDQTALLETLKASLLELFESHDQSVPQSQLSVRKLPAYRPSTVIRESADQPEAGSTTITGQVEDEDLFCKNHPVPCSSNEDTVCLASPTISLMQNFVGRNAKDRSGRSSEPKSITFSKENQRLPNFQNLRSELLSHGQDTIDISVVSGSPEPSMPETNEIPKAVQDFNAREAFLHAKNMEQDSSLSSPAPTVDDDIPSVKHTPQKSSQSTIQNAFDRMRPKRIPAETATITVGNTTTTSTVGSTPRKRRRIHIPQFGLNATPSPLFGRTLRTFAALGTQAENEDDDYTSEDDVRRQDSSMPILASQTDSFSGGHEPKLSPDTDGKNEAVKNPVPLLATENDEAEESDSGNSEYVEEAEKKSSEEARAAHMIASAEELAAGASHDNLRRAASLLKGPGKKYSTLYLVRSVNTSIPSIYQSFSRLGQNVKRVNPRITSGVESDLETATPEERLSLTVSKSDFALMRIIGQFNLGFIIATRPSSDNKLSSTSLDLFIIDQHASDEKYNFERLTADTILTPQRLVHPHPLILTAIEEETILSHSADLTANGFIVSIDTSGTTPVGQRCKLLSLPMSREVTFTPSDLEELLAILSDHVGQEVPRPSKVRRLLASRACRGSVMVGKTLTLEQMEKVVRHMGSMEKPWSCPHGRPTMRHLFGLGGWSSWEEGDGVMGMGEERKMTDWRLWLTDRGKGR
jgi:DNA mismatch repair protein PMS2